MLTAQERQTHIDTLRRFPDVLAARIADLTDTQMTTAYLDGEWTVAQNVHHLADSHMNSYIRLKLILSEERPPLKPYPQDVWATFADAHGADVTATLSLLHGLHARWVTVFASLTEEQRQRVGLHPEVGEVTPDDLLRDYAGHCHAHLDQIERTLAAAG